jgi:hypothetical protein
MKLEVKESIHVAFAIANIWQTIFDVQDTSPQLEPFLLPFPEFRPSRSCLRPRYMYSIKVDLLDWILT